MRDTRRYLQYAMFPSSHRAWTVSIIHHVQLILVINCRTRVEYHANKFSVLIPIKPLGLIVHSLCFLGVNVFAIECMYWAVLRSPYVPGGRISNLFARLDIGRHRNLWQGTVLAVKDWLEITDSNNLIKHNISIFATCIYWFTSV